MKKDYEYIEATKELLERIWEKNIKSNSDDERWIKWREEALANNADGKSKTFLILYCGEPVGEGTLLFSEDCSAISGRTMLADGKETVNINALRIEKVHEGKGHISKDHPIRFPGNSILVIPNINMPISTTVSTIRTVNILFTKPYVKSIENTSSDNAIKHI